MVYVSAYWFTTDELPLANVGAPSASARGEVSGMFVGDE
jgi:hypothetical protein